MLTGTHEDMKRIETDGKLSDWCTENLDWLRKTFGDCGEAGLNISLSKKLPGKFVYAIFFVLLYFRFYSYLKN
jgi:hypothetical protein